MDFTTHQLVKGGIDQSMAGDGRFSGEFGRNNEQTVMTAATSGASVTGMFGRVVDYFQSRGVESGQAFAHQGFDRRCGLVHAGKTFLNGLTLTLA